jgi:ABC-type lipoprotein release transport system permease subunit
MAIPFAYNLRNILRRPLNSIATAIGIGLVVAILIGAFALAAGFQAALVESGSPANAIVMRSGADSEVSSGLAVDAANIIRAHPAIAVAPDGRPLASAELLVLTNLDRLGQSGSSNVPIRGIQVDGLPLRDRLQITAGSSFTPGSDQVIVGERIARRFKNCQIGDVIRFGQRGFTVVGHFRCGGSAFESEIWGDQAVLGPALNRQGFQSLTFRMRDTSQFRAIEAELEGDPRLGVQVRTERDFYSSQSQLLAGVIRVAGVFITMIMAIGAIFGAVNTMYAAVGSRTREIAVLLTLGFSPFAVLTSFMTESVVLALMGGVLGCLLSLPINGIVTSTTNWASFSEVAFAFRVTPMAMVVGLVFAAAMGTVGGFLPALKAARQSLARSLREL